MNFNITFLGTSSGGGPSESRNCSSLIADVVGDGSLWMFDCAEGTIRQFAMYYNEKHRLQANKLTKIFITHMHADHIMGIITVLRNILYPPLADLDPRRLPKIEIFGPAGIRTFIRSILKMTKTKTSDRYVVHELLSHSDEITPCGPSDLHSSEVPGRDILCSPDDNYWHNISDYRPAHNGPEFMINAGPIQHRDPCIGYVVQELTPPYRKLVILGDTHDPSNILPLCVSGPPPSLLVHEATDTHIPPEVDFGLSKRSPETVLIKTLDKGHSTPAMAGAFAREIGAERLVLNHIGGRFPAPRPSGDSRRRAVIHEIETQATKAWGVPGRHAVAAYDYMTVVIPPTRTEFGAEHVDTSQNGRRPGASNQRNRNNPSGRHRGGAQFSSAPSGSRYRTDEPATSASGPQSHSESNPKTSRKKRHRSD